MRRGIRICLALKDPTTFEDADADIMCGEICVGLGESLVGNDPGCALGFRVDKKTKKVVEITSQPSKPVAYYSPPNAYIARSDSNGEDLEEFAGAGLYDSIPTAETAARPADYSTCDVIWNVDFRDRLLQKLCDVAVDVERANGVRAARHRRVRLERIPRVGSVTIEKSALIMIVLLMRVLAYSSSTVKVPFVH